MILALAIIDDARVVIYATIWNVIYERKFTILNLLQYRPLLYDQKMTRHAPFMSRPLNSYFLFHLNVIAKVHVVTFFVRVK